MLYYFSLSIFFQKVLVISLLSNSLAFDFLKKLSSNPMKSLFQSNTQQMSSYDSKLSILSWNDLSSQISATDKGRQLATDIEARAIGGGAAHTDAKVRLFGTSDEPRVTLYRDTAAWCPYCQKVWILLEEKKIPYNVQKINMRSYGDKPQWYLKMVPNGLLPAISLDGNFQTESLDIMLNLDRTFSGPHHRSMWPADGTVELSRALSLMRLERDLFGRWCNLVFRPSSGDSALKRFEEGLNEVNKQLFVTDSPWFLNDLSIVDLTFVTHIERMFASVAFWSGVQLRGNGRWPAIERWIDAFELLPSYMATKSDYYTHVMDIPPQYGPGYFMGDSREFAKRIMGDDGSWTLPLPPLSKGDLEPIGEAINPGDLAARHEAAWKVVSNHEAIAKFALRGAGQPGQKRFQAELADPYATPDLSFMPDMDYCLRLLVLALLDGHENTRIDKFPPADANRLKSPVKDSLDYFRDRIGVPRDMSYPAARQLRAHINWLKDQLW